MTTPNDRITDADIEAIADKDPVWAIAERIVYENHGVGNAAVIIKRAVHAAMIEGARIALEAAAKDAEANEYLAVRLCCNGLGCGCQGSSVGDFFAHEIRALDPETIIKEATDAE